MLEQRRAVLGLGAVAALAMEREEGLHVAGQTDLIGFDHDGFRFRLLLLFLLQDRVFTRIHLGRCLDVLDLIPIPAGRSEHEDEVRHTAVAR